MLSTLIERLDDPVSSETNVIKWGSPVPFFGNLSRSSVATLGLNPSNREFVDAKGNELDGEFRRFHTLSSLRLTRWSDAEQQHQELIAEYCRSYFLRNPYDRWFRELDHLISGTGASYYGASAQACHLDLVPYATACKWTELTSLERSALLVLAGDTLGILLRDSPIRLLILNGQTVVNNLQELTSTRFEKEVIPDWTLPRRLGSGVRGFAFMGAVRYLAGVRLKREVIVLGFNHNIQSSFGMTLLVKAAIRRWITQAADEVIS